MKKIKFFKQLCLVLLVFCAKMKVASAENIIRDAEIESTIYEIARPITEIAGYGKEDIKIFIVDSKAVNAFTIGQNTIFISQGLLNEFPDVDIIRGIIAHELGHIAMNHMPQRYSQIQKANQVATIFTVLGILASAKSTELAMSSVLFGSDYLEKELLKHSRTHEREADSIALKYLEQSGNTARGLLDAFKKFKMAQSIQLEGVNKYEITHPLSEDRLEHVEKFYKNSKYQSSTNSETLNKKFARSIAKLQAFLNPEKEARYINKTDETSLYAKSILLFRNGNKKGSLRILDSLLSKYPNDPFYNELKGQILFSFADKDAYKYYQKAYNLLPQNPVIITSRSIVAYSLFKPEEEEFKNNLQALKARIDQEPNDLAAMRMLFTYYDRAGLKAQSLFYNAIWHHKIGKGKKALSLAKAALRRLSHDPFKKSVLNDIIEKENKKRLLKAVPDRERQLDLLKTILDDR